MEQDFLKDCMVGVTFLAGCPVFPMIMQQYAEYIAKYGSPSNALAFSNDDSVLYAVHNQKPVAAIVFTLSKERAALSINFIAIAEEHSKDMEFLRIFFSCLRRYAAEQGARTISAGALVGESDNQKLLDELGFRAIGTVYALPVEAIQPPIQPIQSPQLLN